MESKKEIQTADKESKTKDSTQLRFGVKEWFVPKLKNRWGLDLRPLSKHAADKL